MRDWRQRLAARFAAAGRTCEPDLLEELADHAASEYEACRRLGRSQDEAAAAVETLVAQWVAEADQIAALPPSLPAPEPPSAMASSWPGLLLHDLRYGARLLRRAPGFASLAVATMALGIGAATLLFSVVYGVLLNPLPWSRPERLVRVTEMRDGRAGRVPGTISNATYHAWRDRRSAVEDLAGWMTQTATLTGAGEATRIALNPITPNLFGLLGAQPAVGRLFTEADGQTGDAAVVLLSYGLWQERFGGRADVVGTAIELDGVPHAIVGVMPASFAFPDRTSRLWTAWQVPQVVMPEGALAGVIFRAIARLRHDATTGDAAAEATALARTAPDLGPAAGALFGAAGPIAIAAVSELEAQTGEVRPAVLLLLAASALLLLTATANVASLQLARAAARRREIAVRASIGAGQGRLARQLLAENALLGVAGGAAGLALAAGLHRLLPWLMPEGFPRLDGIAIDWRAALFALAVSVAVSVLCGLLPAWHTRRVDLVATLSEDGSSPVGGLVRTPVARTRAAIMAGQIAVACFLLVGAALLSRSWLSLITADRGYDPAQVLTARLPLPRAYPAEGRIPLLDGIVERLAAVPGVTHVAYSPSLPLLSPGGFVAFTMRRLDAPDAEVAVQSTQRIVSPGYFGAMGIRLVAGRLLSDGDTAGAPPAIVVNRTFARQYLGERPVGTRVSPSSRRAGFLNFTAADTPWQVVGVVEDMRQETMRDAPQPEIFASFRQLNPATLRMDPVLVMRTTSDPAQLVPLLRAIVRDAAPELALDSIMSMEDRVRDSLARPRLYAAVLVWFGTFAVLIAGVGLFGVLSFSVVQRTREIGVRTALGAGPGEIVGLVLRQVLLTVSGGVLAGVLLAFASARLLATVLHGVEPHDWVAFAAAPAAVIVAAAVACVGPARRAALVGPMTALRRT